MKKKRSLLVNGISAITAITVMSLASGCSFAATTHSKEIITSNTSSPHLNTRVTSNYNESMIYGTDSIRMVTQHIGWDFQANPGNPASQNSIRRTTDGGRTWISAFPPKRTIHQQYAGGTAKNSNSAWLATSSLVHHITTVFYTHDKGHVWKSTIIPKFYLTASFSFIDPEHGWMLASPGPATGQEPVTLYYTDDGGKVWNEVTNSQNPTGIPITGLKTGISFSTLKTGWITIDNGLKTGEAVIYVTHDVGHTWSPQHISVPMNLNKVYAHPEAPVFSSPEDGVLPVSYSEKGILLYVTHNNGTSWTTSSLIATNNNIDIHVSTSDAKTVWITNGVTVYVCDTTRNKWNSWQPGLHRGYVIMDLVLRSPNMAVTYVMNNGQMKQYNLRISNDHIVRIQ